MVSNPNSDKRGHELILEGSIEGVTFENCRGCVCVMCCMIMEDMYNNLITGSNYLIR